MREKKETLWRSPNAYQSGVGFFQFVQDISGLFAISKDKASLFPQKHSQLPRLLPPSTLSAQSGIKVRLRVASGETSTHSGPASDLAHTPSAAPRHSYRPGLSRMYVSRLQRMQWEQWNAAVSREIFRVFPQCIKKPLTNCRRFICHNLRCGLCLIHRAWKSYFFHRNNLQPPDF